MSQQTLGPIDLVSCTELNSSLAACHLASTTPARLNPPSCWPTFPVDTLRPKIDGTQKTAASEFQTLA